MPSFLYLLGLGFLLLSIGSCATSATPVAGYAHMLAWVICWVGGGIIERLPVPADKKSGGLSFSNWLGDRSTRIPATVTDADRAELERLGITYRNGEYWVANEHYLRVGDAIARGRALRRE